MLKINFNSHQMFYDIEPWHKDEELKKLIKSCIDSQKAAGEKKFKADFKANPNASRDVSEEKLNEILKAQQDVSDIRTNTDISNCLVFHSKNLDGSVIDENFLNLKQKADETIIARIKDLFDTKDDLAVEVSGLFWYPQGGYMGWHTNLRKPGWRMYINYAEEEGKSFFRYRDPDTKKIVTAIDKEWNFRLFKITPEKPFWHSVYSDTNRFSLGYMIKTK